jgi:hypothetical protein
MAMVTLLRLSGFYTKWQRTVRITSTDALIDGHPAPHSWQNTASAGFSR